MKLYTVLVDWQAGTYTRQVRAENELQALLEWLRQLARQPLPGCGPATRQQLLAKAKQGEMQPVPLDGLLNVWCATALAQGSLLLVHLICTENN